MGFFRSQDPTNAAAAVVLRIDTSRTWEAEWFGESDLQLRAPSVYLDWALNKDKPSTARRALSEARRQFIETRDTFKWVADEPPLWDGGFPTDYEVTISLTSNLRCDVAYRPRAAIARHLYFTFWILWAKVIERLSAEETGTETAVELTLDMIEQLEMYEIIGLGMRGGVAPMRVAERRNQIRRQEFLLAESAGISIADYRDLAEEEQRALFDAFASRNNLS